MEAGTPGFVQPYGWTHVCIPTEISKWVRNGMILKWIFRYYIYGYYSFKLFALLNQPIYMPKILHKPALWNEFRLENHKWLYDCQFWFGNDFYCIIRIELHMVKYYFHEKKQSGCFINTIFCGLHNVFPVRVISSQRKITKCLLNT